MGEKDLTEKTLVAFDDVFADIVNGLLFGGDTVIGEYGLEDAQPFSMYKADGKLHEQERNVSKYWEDRSGDGVNARLAFLGIENQTEFDKDMPLRVIGYDGAAYRSELQRDERYPVMTLVLYFGNKPWGNRRTLYEALQIPEQFRHADELLKLMTVLTQDSRFEETLLWKGGKPENMCQVLDRVEARGMEKGIEENRIENIKTVMRKLSYTAKQAMDLLDIPLTERGKYTSRL